MATSLTLTSASVASATFHSSASVSQVRVSGAFQGQVVVQESIPGEGDWETILIVNGNDGAILATPDLAMDLRVLPVIQSGTAKFYFGP